MKIPKTIKKMIACLVLANFVYYGVPVYAQDTPAAEENSGSLSAEVQTLRVKVNQLEKTVAGQAELIAQQKKILEKIAEVVPEVKALLAPPEPKTLVKKFVVNGSMLFTAGELEKVLEKYDDLVLTANSVVYSASGNIEFDATITGAYTLKADAVNGSVTFSGQIGADNATALAGLTVDASRAILYADIYTGGGNVDLRQTNLVTLASDVTITSGANSSTAGGDILFGQASTISGDWDLTLDTTGTSTNGSVQINDADINQLTLTGTAVATLFGTIETDDGLDLSGAASIVLGDDVSLITTGTAADISIGGVTGAYDLSVNAGQDVNVTGTITGATSVTMTAGGDVDVDYSITSSGQVSLTSGGASGEDIELDANLIGSAVILEAGTSGKVTIGTAAQNNTAGSTTINAGGGITTAVGISAAGDLTINDTLTITAAVTLASTNGDIDLNGAVNSDSGNTWDLTLTANNGTVYTEALGTTVRLENLDINANQLVLDGNIAAESVDTSDVGLTTLVAAIDIDTTVGAGTINLGRLAGANNLTISAGTSVTLSDADIASLTIDDAYSVDFNGNFVTSGAVSVTGVDSYIQIGSGGSIQAGGVVTLRALGTTGSYVENYGAISAVGNIDIRANDYVSVDADITTEGTSTIYINADVDNAASGSSEGCYIGYSSAASVSSENGDITLIGRNVYVGYNGGADGEVTTTGVGNVYIDVSQVAEDTGTIWIYSQTVASGVDAGGAVYIGQTYEPATLVIDQNCYIQAEGAIIADAGTITAAANSSITSLSGDIDLQTSSGDLTVNGDITAVGHTVTLTSAAEIKDSTDETSDITAKTLHASSVTGINNTVSTYLDTDVDYITASASGAGDIYIQEEDGVTLTSVTAANGSIGIVTGNEAAGDAIVTNVVAAGSGADIDITADLGDIYLATVTAADDSVSITASNGAIFDDNVNTTKVTATDLSLSAVGQIGAPGTEGDIDTTTTNLTAATTNGDIYITDDDAVTLTSITTGTGSITIKNGRSSSGNMTVTLVTAGTSDAGDGDVTLETLDGNIILSGPVSAQNDSVTLISSNDVTDNYGSGPDIVASALYLQAGGSFGTSGNPIVTQVSTIDDVAIGSNVAGNIYISEYDGVDLGSLNGLSTDNGNIYVNSNATANGDLVASNITAGGSGDIYLTSQDGAGGTNDIALGYVNAQGNTVTLVSDDNITDEDADPDIDVVANILYLEAAGDCGASGTDAAIDTDVAYISNRSASTVVAGALYINENSGVTLGADGSNTYGLTSTSGPIYITAANGADGNLIATSVITVNSSAPITLITNAGVGGLNDINVKYISSTSSTVTLVSDNDITAVDDSSSITATSLLLEANGSAGTSSLPLRVYSSYIDDRSASANVYGNIYITVLDLASPTAATIRLGYINGLSTDNGNISITLTGAGDTLSAVSVTAGGTGDVTLVTSGASSDIAVGLITALDDDVYLYAQNRITDSDTTEVDVIANGLYLRTDYGSVGSSTNYLDVQVTTIDNQSAGNVYGSIYISEYDGVNLGSVNGLTTDTGSIYVTSNATADGTLIATLVTARGSGDISLKSQAGASSTGNVNDIEVGLLTASGDDVILNSNDDIIDLTYDEVVDIEASGLYLAAGGTVGGDGSGRELDTRVSTIDDISGSNVYESIYIIEYDGVSLGSVNGLTTDTGDIDITAANTAAGDMDAVSVTAGGEGNILLITLDGGSVSNSINVGLVTAEGDDVSLVSDGDITDADTTGLDVVASVLYLQSGGAVGTSANYLDTKVANIDDYSGGNVGTDLYINEYDGVTLGSLNTSTGLSTTDGEIRVIAAATAAGDLTATLLTAGGTGNNIYLTTADGGSGTNSIGLGLVTAEDDDVIIDSDYDVTDSDADSAADVVADGLYLDALGSVGTSTDRVETTVNTIDDYALGVNVSGSIYISETDAVTLGSIFGLTTDAGVIDIVAGGTITTGTLAANGGFGIFLNSTGGDLVDLVNGSFTATAKSELRTGGIIGTIENPYDVNVTSGGLWVWAGSQNREVSANLRGTVVSSADTERVEIFEPSPPGLVIFDNHLMGGGNYGSGSANGSILSRGYGYISVFRADFIDSVYARALEQPWGYKLLLAWALAEGPKVDEKLMSDVPTVIDVTQLNLPVLYMDMNKPMDYYVIRSIR